jgi:iron complex outermembrane receptor protein
MTASDIASAGIQDARDLAPYTPGLWIEYSVTGQSSRTVTFRGDSADPGLIFIDGAPYGGNSNPDLGDLARVEVLVGPQSAYFGRSTFTGAINYITKDPSDTFKGQVSAQYSSYNSNTESMTLEGPIVRDRLGIVVTASHYYAGGEWTNGSDTNEKMGAVQKDSVSASVLFTPNDQLRVKAFLSYVLDRDGQEPAVQLSAFNYKGVPGAQYQSQQLTCNQGGTLGPYWCGALPSAKALPGMDVPGLADIISANTVITPYLYNILFNNALHLEPTLFDPHWMSSGTTFQQLTEAAHLNADYTSASGWVFSSVTALHKTKWEQIYLPDYRDEQGVPNPDYPSHANTLPYIAYFLLEENLTYDGSQEFRVTSPQDQRLRGTAGANYFNIVSPGTDNYGQEPAGPGIAGSVSRSVSSTPAIFGGIYYDLMPALTLSAEARYQWDRISATAKFPTAVPTLESTFKSFSPRVTLDYKIDPDQLLYGLWSRGYKPGGFNASLVGQSASVFSQLSTLGAGLTYAQERIDNFEGGLKSTWLNGRIRTTLDAYYDQWRDGQVANTLSVTSGTGNATFSLTQNVGAVNMYGIEFTGAAALTDHLTITGNYDYQTSKIESYVFLPNGPRLEGSCIANNGSTCVVGNKFPNAPVGSTFTIAATYTDHLAGAWDWYATPDWKHRGRYYIDATNLAWIAATDTVDLHVGMKDETKTIEAFVTNLFNQENFSNGMAGTDPTCCVTPSNINSIRVLLPQKRSFGIKAKYDF